MASFPVPTPAPPCGDPVHVCICSCVCIQLRRQTEPVSPAWRGCMEKAPDFPEGPASGWHSGVCLIPGDSIYGLPMKIEPFCAVLKGLWKEGGL